MDNHPNTCYDGDERVDLRAGCSKCWYDCVVFNNFLAECGIWAFVVAIGKFKEFFDVW